MTTVYEIIGLLNHKGQKQTYRWTRQIFKEMVLKKCNVAFFWKCILFTNTLAVYYCVCVHSAWKGRPRNDLYCFRWDVKPYSLTITVSFSTFSCIYISQGSAATQLTCGGIFIYHFVKFSKDMADKK